jgi:hypothetical protein
VIFVTGSIPGSSTTERRRSETQSLACFFVHDQLKFWAHLCSIGSAEVRVGMAQTIHLSWIRVNSGDVSSMQA